MSGNWVWEQAVSSSTSMYAIVYLSVFEDALLALPDMHGTMFVPVILSSDKTTVSVATGQNEYYPLYLSNGLVHNTTRRAQRNAVSLIAFLAIPKSVYRSSSTPCMHTNAVASSPADREFKDDVKFRKFRRQLFHTSLHAILQSLKPGMTKPEVVRYGDGHFRRTIYGLGPYIADYPEQALLACIVQGWCAKYVL